MQLHRPLTSAALTLNPSPFETKILFPKPTIFPLSFSPTLLPLQDKPPPSSRNVTYKKMSDSETPAPAPVPVEEEVEVKAKHDPPPPLRPVEDGVDIEKFKYWLWTPEEVIIAEFDASVKACEPFGFYHGQRVKHTKGGYQDAISTVIGVREGVLYYDPDGQSIGALCTHNLNVKEDFENELGWKMHGETYIAEAHATGSPKYVEHKIRELGASPTGSPKATTTS